MSRLAKKPIVIPKGTTAKMDGRTFTVKGPKGELTKNFRSEIDINVGESEITVVQKRTDILSRALVGTYASHIKNMIAGVNKGYEKKLILEGVGFKSNVAGKTLTFALGFSHPVKIAVPAELTVTAEQNVITVTGIDKELVGTFAAKLRDQKKPEPYKGKGMRYHDEVIRRKQGKKTV